MKKAVLLIIVVLASSLLIQSCRFFKNPLPEVARLEITSQDIEEVDLVISLNFLAQRRGVMEEGIVVGDTTEILPLTSDTMLVSLPFDQEYDIGDRHRIFAEIEIVEEDLDKDLIMRGWIDGEERFNTTLESHENGKLRFVYYFQQGRDNIIRPQP